MGLLEDVETQLAAGTGLYIKSDKEGGLSIDLYDQGLDDAMLEKIAVLCKDKNIVKLDLSRNNIMDRDAKLLASAFPKLTVLNLESNHFRDKSCEYLAEMKHLTELNISNNGLTQDGIKKLEDAFKGKKLSTEGNPGSPPISDPLGLRRIADHPSLFLRNVEVEIIPNDFSANKPAPPMNK